MWIPTAIQMLVKSLKPAQNLLKDKGAKPHFMEESHITIAHHN